MVVDIISRQFLQDVMERIIKEINHLQRRAF